MTMLQKDIARCGVCGKGNEVLVMTSTSRFGACDLDTRPPAMFPFTIFLQHCEHCGYVAPKIADGNSRLRDFIETETYKTCDGIDPISTVARDYIRYALLQGYTRIEALFRGEKVDADQYKAFMGFLNAAWACDDMAEHKSETGKNYNQYKCSADAEECRKRCLLLINTLIVNNEKQKETLLGIKADLLRRTRQFDAVIVEFENKKFQDALVDQVIKFEVERAKEKDDKRYNMNHVEVQGKNKI